ncbi:MAG TPA: hypothetical protein VGG35_07610 [Streptosporangiaceae bacterium]|jgi:hypothetical protein
MSEHSSAGPAGGGQPESRPERGPGLEQRYRRLLAWYPEPFRSEHQDEMLAVLLASAGPGRRRPGLADSADVLKSAAGMRLRRVLAGAGQPGRADALAVFSLIAPLFLVTVSLLEVALPYRFPLPAGHGPGVRFIEQLFGSHPQIGGLSLFSEPGFAVALGGQVIIAGLAIAGRRRLALAAVALAAGYWIFSRYWIPGPLQVLSTSVYLLEAAALLASPGPRRGRQLVTWRHGLVLALAAAAVQASALADDRASPLLRFAGLHRPGAASYAVAVALGAAAVLAAILLRLNAYLVVVLAAAVYPWAMQLSFIRRDGGPLGLFTPGRLAVIYLPPLLVAGAAMLITLERARGAGGGQPAERDEPRPA